MGTLQKRYYVSCSYFGVTTKNHHLRSCADVGMSTAAKKTTLAQAYKRIFRLEKRKSRNDHSAMHM